MAEYIHLRLAWMGFPPVDGSDAHIRDIASGLLAHHRETARLLSDHLPPPDRRIQDFLHATLPPPAPRLPSNTFVLDRPGLASVLSLPLGGDVFRCDMVESYRVKQGILHNPRSDKRTTEGSFHIAEGGLPIPADKRAVPLRVFNRLVAAALAPPPEFLRLPFTAGRAEPVECWVSLLIRPVVCPAVAGHSPHKSMETRFFAPGSMVANLDFIERIFGNAGDPILPENDAGLDVEHWTGHTGCVILAPHLTRLHKQDLGLLDWASATERQRRDGMCWNDPAELYNGGQPFKVTARDERGVMVTVIADNYFGYCKKEVKSQISYAANLYGRCEEEHAGGALVFSSQDLGEGSGDRRQPPGARHTFSEAIRLLGGTMDIHPDGYAVDKRFSDIVYVPEGARFDIKRQRVAWDHPLGDKEIKLLAGHTYVFPTGNRVTLVKPPGGRAWRLVGTIARPVMCHKPATVSGGGKSEIAKPITDIVLNGPVIVTDLKRDLDQVEDLLQRDYSGRFRVPRDPPDQRPVLSRQRSLGSVIKMLTPSDKDFTDEYNAWLDSIPHHIRELALVVKRFYREEWGKTWRDHFSVDVINGVPGNELKLHGRKLVAIYVRVGFEGDGHWRTFGLRKDFHPAVKFALEDDITASVVVPDRHVNRTHAAAPGGSAKIVHNSEAMLFQRPDDAIVRGHDLKTEADFATEGNLFSNYEPLTSADARELVEESIGFSEFSDPMQCVLREAAACDPGGYVVSSAHPRLVGGKPSKNPRYLQTRLDLANPREQHLVDVALRLDRRLGLEDPLHVTVDAVLPGKRNNPPDPAAGIRSLAVFNPIHHLELPELFMELICSLTGKSPSTTGAGSEGALTKGPFNALLPIVDLNNALVSYVLTGHAVFITASGWVGPKVRVDHDLSLLVPEIWCRMTPVERDPAFLVREGYLERCADFTHQGRRVHMGLLGYRITRSFVRSFFGRIFHHPNAVITDEMLRPETQDLDLFVEGMDNTRQTQRKVAENYFLDGSVELACPPLKALLHIMRDDEYEGKGIQDPAIRALFTREQVCGSPWYAARLATQQALDVRLWERHVAYLEGFLARPSYVREAARLGIPGRLLRAKDELQRVGSGAYLQDLEGTLGASPLTPAVQEGG